MQTPGADEARRAVRMVRRSRTYRSMVRAGLIAYGVMHLFIGFLVLRLATGSRGEEASQTGALRALAEMPAGPALLWVTAVGFIVLAAWQVFTVALGQHEFTGAKRWVKRFSSLGRSVVYLALGGSAVKIAGGSDRGRGDVASDAGVSLMPLPFGQLLVAGVGVAVGTVGVMLAIKTFTDSWQEDLRGPLPRFGTWFARVGHFAKGTSFVGIGLVFLAAAIAYAPTSTGGLDAAFQVVNAWPVGPWVLGPVAAGFVCYGLYCFLWARHAKL